MERAAARRIAKESLELIEDERLELMELAASSKGLSSIVSLDYDTLQGLESFRGVPPRNKSHGIFVLSCNSLLNFLVEILQ